MKISWKSSLHTNGDTKPNWAIRSIDRSYAVPVNFHMIQISMISEPEYESGGSGFEYDHLPFSGGFAVHL